ncbi:MAG: response regulator, partial [Pseudomonadota bacterium]
MNGAPSSSTVPTAARYLRPKILVADDDDGVRAGLVANLELEGYSVSEARDGAEAMWLLGGQTFDLVVSDVVMPVA